MNVIVFPAFCVDGRLGEDVKREAPKDGFSVSTADFNELDVSLGVELSVIVTFPCTVFPTSELGNAHVNELDVDDIPVYREFANCVPVILLSINQLAVYGAVPPVHEEEKVMD